MDPNSINLESSKYVSIIEIQYVTDFLWNGFQRDQFYAAIDGPLFALSFCTRISYRAFYFRKRERHGNSFDLFGVHSNRSPRP